MRPPKRFVRTVAAVLLTVAGIAVVNIGTAQAVNRIQATSISVGGETSLGYGCALLVSGQVLCWGDGAPVAGIVPGINTAVNIAAGKWHTCAALQNGNVKCWGSNEYGQLGADETWISSKIRNDIFSLGDINIWQNSLLCLVTETEFSNRYPQNFFASEKTFKPILGMRPFFIYGQPRLREYLKQQGFDTFEDVFDYASIDESIGDPERQQQYAQVAISAINSVKNPAQEYTNKYFGRCQYNKNHFRDYVYNHWQRLYNLDLTQYV